MFLPYLDDLLYYYYFTITRYKYIEFSTSRPAIASNPRCSVYIALAKIYLRKACI